MSSQFNFSGKISHDLLGSVEIPLKNIPASGVRNFCKIKRFFDKRQLFSCQKDSLCHQVSGWWNLEKPETKKQKARGEIHLTMTLRF